MLNKKFLQVFVLYSLCHYSLSAVTLNQVFPDTIYINADQDKKVKYRPTEDDLSIQLHEAFLDDWKNAKEGDYLDIAYDIMFKPSKDIWLATRIKPVDHDRRFKRAFYFGPNFKPISIGALVFNGKKSDFDPAKLGVLEALNYGTQDGNELIIEGLGGFALPSWNFSWTSLTDVSDSYFSNKSVIEKLKANGFSGKFDYINGIHHFGFEITEYENASKNRKFFGMMMKRAIKQTFDYVIPYFSEIKDEEKKKILDIYLKQFDDVVSDCEDWFEQQKTQVLRPVFIQAVNDTLLNTDKNILLLFKERSLDTDSNGFFKLTGDPGDADYDPENLI
jgi:hypothetical protein